MKVKVVAGAVAPGKGLGEAVTEGAEVDSAVAVGGIPGPAASPEVDVGVISPAKRIEARQNIVKQRNEVLIPKPYRGDKNISLIIRSFTSHITAPSNIVMT